MFRVGQKVVCVDTTIANTALLRPYEGGWQSNKLIKGQIYTISAVGLVHPFDLLGLPAVHVAELDPTFPIWAHRFRPIVDRKTDISVFQEILRKVTRPSPVDAEIGVG